MVLVIVTPGVIDIWEGIVTLLMFPLLVAVAFGQDKGWAFGKGSPIEKEHIVGTMKVEPLDSDDERRNSIDLNKEGEVQTREEVEAAIKKMTENKEKKTGRLQ